MFRKMAEYRFTFINLTFSHTEFCRQVVSTPYSAGLWFKPRDQLSSLGVFSLFSSVPPLGMTASFRVLSYSSLSRHPPI